MCFFMTMHRIISDAWSVGLLRRDLAAFYATAVRGQDPLLLVEPLPIHYRDYSVWQREQAQLNEHQQQLRYWIMQLETSRPAELLCDKPRPPALSGQTSVRQLT